MIEKLKELEDTFTVTLGGRMIVSKDKEKIQETIRKINEIINYINEKEEKTDVA
jgi:uncharacterized protein YlzI (FlbEa/FlbD family)